MKFKNVCLVRINTPDLISFLQNIGYIICSCCSFEGADWLTTGADGVVHGVGYGSDDEGITGEMAKAWWSESKDIIDCGDNVDLFKALAAMRDDSDLMQWFVTDADQSWVNLGTYAPKGSWELCLVKDRYMGRNPDFCSSIVPAHKATIQEIMDHFKNETTNARMYIARDPQKGIVCIYSFNEGINKIESLLESLSPEEYIMDKSDRKPKLWMCTANADSGEIQEVHAADNIKTAIDCSIRFNGQEMEICLFGESLAYAALAAQGLFSGLKQSEYYRYRHLKDLCVRDKNGNLHYPIYDIRTGAIILMEGDEATVEGCKTVYADYNVR